MIYGNKEFELMLNNIIDKRIKENFRNNGIEVPYEGVILSVVEDIEDVLQYVQKEADKSAIEDGVGSTISSYSQYAEVQVAGFNTSVKLRNLSGEILSVGDRVRIYATLSNLSNGYIGIKCK